MSNKTSIVSFWDKHIAWFHEQCTLFGYKSDEARICMFTQNPCFITFKPQESFYQHGLTEYQAWITNHIPVFVWNVITHPYPTFYGSLTEPELSSEIGEWSKPTLYVDILIYLCFNPVKEVPGTIRIHTIFWILFCIQIQPNNIRPLGMCTPLILLSWSCALKGLKGIGQEKLSI